jgi:hypothetical protein
MLSSKDIKIVLFLGYVVGYSLAVVPPIFIDHRLASHTIYYPPRNYPDAILCLPIGAALLTLEIILLYRSKNVTSIYASVVLFIVSIVCSLPIFKPEMPHGNLFVVGATTSFLSAFTIFVWWMCDNLARQSMTVVTCGPGSLEYLKTIYTLARQSAFAGVTLFGALFFAAFTTESKYLEATVTSKSDIFLLNLNIQFQIAFYATYSVIGAIRYFFVATITILSKLRTISIQSDQEIAQKEQRGSSDRTT